MIKLLTSLKRQPADNCIILTYNVDLPFYEYMVFEPLYAAGCRNALVVCDPVQYEQALRDVPLLKHAGQRYLLLPGRTSPSGAFHPKLILLTSDGGGRLYVTSGNLTKAGYTRNWEVVTLFEYHSNKPDPVAWTAFRWAFDVVSQVIDRSAAPELAAQRLEQIMGTTPWLREEPPLSPSAQAWLLHNLDRPLWAQVLERYQQEDGSPVDEAVVVSPFFDGGARAIAALLADCHPQRLRLYTQGPGHGLSPRVLEAVLGRHPVKAEAYDLELGARRLHAKTLLLRTQSGVWAATGSANFSAPAWLHPASSGNTELIVLRFEPDAAHFDTWLGRLTINAMPLDLSEPAELEQETPVASQPSFELLSASREGRRLVLRLAQALPAGARLTVQLAGQETAQFCCECWQTAADHTIVLQVPASVSLPDTPQVVSLVVGPGPKASASNPVLLHNLQALRHFGQPAVRRDRPHIPPAMQPESYEHCVQILEMLHDLLATNSEQLRRHRGILTAQARQRERQMEVENEGEYDPEEHFVDEQIRRRVVTSGAELYADYPDQLTYESVLRAILAAVYHPAPVPGDGSPEDISFTLDLPEPPPPPDDAAEAERLRTRIANGFRRLVRNFAQGTNDETYMAEVPPRYLAELFVIIGAYLRVVWRSGMLDRDCFLDCSRELFGAFWGKAGQPGAWEQIRTGMPDDELTAFMAQVQLGAQSWLHAYIVSEQTQEDEADIYELAAWLRHLHAVLGPPADVLSALRIEDYQRLWRASTPADAELLPAQALAEQLNNWSRPYNDATLLSEISTWASAEPHISYATQAGLSRVPSLEVTMPLTEEDLDRCLRVFVLFLAWPQAKSVAWARFSSPKPEVDTDDIQQVTIFYRGDEHSLLFAVKRGSGKYHPCIDRYGVTAQVLARASVSDLAALGSDR